MIVEGTIMETKKTVTDDKPNEFEGVITITGYKEEVKFLMDKTFNDISTCLNTKQKVVSNRSE